jgi:hypothetical protein
MWLPWCAEVKRWYDKKGNESDGRAQHDEPLRWLPFRSRPSPQAALKQHRVVSHEIKGSEDRCASEDRQIDPCLPVVHGPGGDKEQKTHDDRENREAEPCFGVEIHHSTICSYHTLTYVQPKHNDFRWR